MGSDNSLTKIVLIGIIIYLIFCRTMDYGLKAERNKLNNQTNERLLEIIESTEK